MRRLVVMTAVAGSVWRNVGERGVDELQSVEHVDIPVEEEADFGGAAAGDGADGEQAGDAVDRVFDGLVMVTSICSTGMTPLSTPMTTRGKLVCGKTETGVEGA